MTPPRRKTQDPHYLRRFVLSTGLAGLCAIGLWVGVSKATTAAGMAPLPPAPLTPSQALLVLVLLELAVVATWYLAPWATRATTDLIVHAARSTYDRARARMTGRARTPRAPRAERAHAVPLEKGGRAPKPERVEAVAERTRQVLTADVDPEVQVAVARWHGGENRGVPATFVIDYPPRATRAVREGIVSVRDTISRAYPPRHDEWHIAWDASCDQIILTDRPDPLAPVVSLPPIEADPDLTRAGGALIGVREQGQERLPWRLPILGVHALLAGASGSGKGSHLWALIRALAPMIADGRVVLWVADPKGGVEFDRVEPFAHRFATDPSQVTKMLADAADAMHEQAQALRRAGKRKLEVPTPQTPLHLVIVDELASVVGRAAMGDPQVKKDAAAALGALLTKGRALGFSVVAALQDPRKENVPDRTLFLQTIALRMNEPAETNLILGSGARAAGALADAIPAHLPGIAYVLTDGRTGHQRVRAAFISDEEIAAMSAHLVERIAARTRAPLDLDAEEHQVPAQVEAAPRTRAHTPARAADQGEQPARAPRTPRASTKSTVLAREAQPGARVHLDDDAPEVAVVVDVEPDPAEEGYVLLTWHPEGRPDAQRTMSLEDGEHLRLA